ncbi:ester cyclase [Streptomyces sp. NPDC051561]|uniref:ester cyclase n=1 Tax=Streptomyces sp. NPDC051561 TaxID=3365658 RepID=UPI003790A776
MNDTTTEKSLALLRTAYDLLNSGDVDACAGLSAPDFIANLPGLPDPVYGREAWKLGTRAMLDAFHDLRIDVEEMFAVDDRVAVRVSFRGTHGGPFQGVPATQRTVGFRSIEMYRVVGNEVAEEWVAPDLAGLMRQIAQPADA